MKFPRFFAAILALTPLAAQAQTFQNPSFSAGEATPDAWALTKDTDAAKAAISRDTANFQSGPASLKLELKGGKGTVTQNPTGPFPTENVQFGLATKTAGDITELSGAFQVFDGGWKQIAWISLNLSPSTDWKKLGQQIQFPAGSQNAVFYVWAQGTGTVWIDDVMAGTPEKAPVAPAAPQNLGSVFPNPSFSEGDTNATGWKLSGDADAAKTDLSRDTNVFASAPASLRFDTIGGAKASLTQNLLKIPSGEWLLSISSKNVGDIKNFNGALQVFDGNWKQLAWIPIKLGLSADWTTYQTTIHFPEEAKNAALHLWAEGDGRVWMDDLSVVAAPGSVAVLPSEAQKKTLKPCA